MRVVVGFIHASMAIIILSAFTILASIVYWETATYNELSPDDNVLQVYTPIVGPGDAFIYGRYWCKETARSGIVARELIDGFHYNLAVIQPQFGPGCRYTKLAIEIPKVPPGMYRLHVTMSFHVNPLRWRNYEFWTPPFEIREPGAAMAAVNKALPVVKAKKK